MAIKKITKYLGVIVNSYPETVFLKGYFPGIALILCAFINPNVGFCGLICVLSAYLFTFFIGINREFLKTGYYTYNPLLVGLSLGFVFKLNILTLFFLVSAGILTLVITVALSNFLYNNLALPVLSIPFVMVSSLSYLASLTFSNLYVSGLYSHPQFFSQSSIPLWFEGLTKAAGAIFFAPNILSGCIILLLILYCSRILFFLAVSGYFLGVSLIAAMTGSYYQAFTDIYALNFILIAMAMGGVFLIPSLKSYAIAMICVSVSPFMLESAKTFWSEYRIPVFTLPFNIVTLSFLYFLKFTGFSLITKRFLKNPEQTLDHHLAASQRYKGTLQSLFLPFSGSWTVWQGNNGPWTHKGAWRYAFDFVITDANNSTFANSGQSLEDYYCFKKPVLSPIAGRIANVIRMLPDNVPGQTDRRNNWGNTIVLYDLRGFYVVLSHLAHDSIKGAIGDWVERGQLIGLCGNSGYSPQPHLHVQVQSQATLGAQTLPSSFVSYILDESKAYHSNGIPKEKEKITPLFSDNALDKTLSFLMDDSMDFSVSVNGKKRHETLRVKSDALGNLYFQSKKSKLYFEKTDGAYYHYLLEGFQSVTLKALFLAMPRAPTSFNQNIYWEDYLPLAITKKPFLGNALLFLKSFTSGRHKTKGKYQFLDQNEITGQILSNGNRPVMDSKIVMHPDKGFESIVLKQNTHVIEIKRI